MAAVWAVLVGCGVGVGRMMGDGGSCARAEVAGARRPKARARGKNHRRPARRAQDEEGLIPDLLFVLDNPTLRRKACSTRAGMPQHRSASSLPRGYPFPPRFIPRAKYRPPG